MHLVLSCYIILAVAAADYYDHNTFKLKVLAISRCPMLSTSLLTMLSRSLKQDAVRVKFVSSANIRAFE